MMSATTGSFLRLFSPWGSTVALTVNHRRRAPRMCAFLPPPRPRRKQAFAPVCAVGQRPHQKCRQITPFLPQRFKGGGDPQLDHVDLHAASRSFFDERRAAPSAPVVWRAAQYSRCGRDYWLQCIGWSHLLLWLCGNLWPSPQRSFPCGYQLLHNRRIVTATPGLLPDASPSLRRESCDY